MASFQTGEAPYFGPGPAQPATAHKSTPVSREVSERPLLRAYSFLFSFTVTMDWKLLQEKKEQKKKEKKWKN